MYLKNKTKTRIVPVKPNSLYLWRIADIIFELQFYKSQWVSAQQFFDHWSLTGLQMSQCITLDDHWNKPNLVCFSLPSVFYHGCCLCSVYVHHLHFPSLQQGFIISLYVPSSGHFDLLGGSILLLADHAWDVFSCSHSAAHQCTTIFFLPAENGRMNAARSPRQDFGVENPVRILCRPEICEYQQINKSKSNTPKYLHSGKNQRMLVVDWTRDMATED